MGKENSRIKPSALSSFDGHAQYGERLAAHAPSFDDHARHEECGVAGILSFIFIIIGGIKIITASGDEKKLASAQATITYAIIGLVVTALAFVILRVVQYFLKSNVPIT